MANCNNCKHMRSGPPEDFLDDFDPWQYCERPNYPKGQNWNILTSVQRWGKEEYQCGGRYFERK